MKRLIIFTAALLAALTATAAALQLDQQTLAGKLIRLHVVANSDSEQDQAVKLQVRDAVLEVTKDLDREELVKDLRRLAKTGDVLLFKGSRGMQMELVLERLLEDER